MLAETQERAVHGYADRRLIHCRALIIIMSPLLRNRLLRWTLPTLLGAVLLGLWRDLRQREHTLAAWLANARSAGWLIETSRVEPGVLSTKLRQLRVKRADVAGLEATASNLVVPSSLLGHARLSTESLRLTFTGEPSAVFDALQSTQWSWVAPRSVALEYAHPLLGRVVLEGATSSANGARRDLHADSVRIGTTTWHDVSLAVQRRNRLLELGVGSGPIPEARIHFGYFPPSRGASQWTLTIVHQPARSFGQQLGWDPGVAFEPSFIGGTVALVVPERPGLEPRGSIQAVIDNWPKPEWPDADALFGSTASFFARVEPAADRRVWNLPEVDLSQALFSLKGTGRLTFGSPPSLLFDLSGARSCAQLESNLPASSYADQVKRYLATCPPGTAPSACDARRREQVTVRVQLAAVDLAKSVHRVAWHLEAGCGLTERNSGEFVPMDLPADTSKPH
jgi:hypothetical protein